MLRDFERVDLITADIDWAIQQLWLFKLSHNVGGNDCLIASVSHRLQIPLYTTNLKHFAPLLGVLAQKPY
jgi:predicted nucleic acid-binding protein